MPRLILDNRLITLEGVHISVIKAIKEVTSYLVAGHRFAPSFKSGFWDGRTHLLTFSEKRGYTVPIGMLEDVAEVLKEWKVDYDVVDLRKVHTERRKINWNENIQLRNYQLEAVLSVTRDIRKARLFGNGIIKMPIRSGKTKTAARIISILGHSTLFIVPSQMLLYQTISSLEEALCTEIGIIGDSEFDPKFITVATAQTLTLLRGRRYKDKHGKWKTVPRDPRYADLIKRIDVIIADEFHHFKGTGEWHKTIQDFDARFKIGLSATALLDNKREQSMGVIWLKASCGPIRIDVPSSRLIKDGFLMRQNVLVYPIRKPDNIAHMKWSQTLRRRGIVANEYRNDRIAALAHQFAHRMKVLVVSNSLEQIQMIVDALESRGAQYGVVVGKHQKHKRQEVIDDYLSGDFNILIGTVFGEGIDIPEIECVINAEGGRDAKATIQRMRNMTIAEGKTEATLIDFMDHTNSYFTKHSKERLKVYRSESEFSVTVKESSDD